MKLSDNSSVSRFNSLKIAVFSSSAPFGRGESFVVSEVNAIAKRNVQVLIVPTILRKGSPNRFVFRENVSVVSIPLLSLSSIFELIALIFGRFTDFADLLMFAKAGSLRNTLKNILVIPKAVLLSKLLRRESVEHIHAHWLTTPSTMALMVSHLSGIPWSCTGHRGDIVANNGLEQKFESAGFVRFISKSGFALGCKLAPLNRSNAVILHMGVSIDSDARNYGEAPETHGKVKIFCPANLVPVKGHEYLLIALSKMNFRNQVLLEIVGEGERKSELEKLVSDLNIQSQVNFRGHLANKELLNIYASGQADIVVLPSRDLGGGVHEGIPVSLMEAMAYKIPVISTKTGGIPELLEDGAGERYGVLVDADNSGELAASLDWLVSSADERQALGSKGFDRVYAEFNQEIIAEHLIQLIRKHQGSSSL